MIGCVFRPTRGRASGRPMWSPLTRARAAIESGRARRRLRADSSRAGSHPPRTRAQALVRPSPWPQPWRCSVSSSRSSSAPRSSKPVAPSGAASRSRMAASCRSIRSRGCAFACRSTSARRLPRTRSCPVPRGARSHAPLRGPRRARRRCGPSAPSSAWSRRAKASSSPSAEGKVAVLPRDVGRGPRRRERLRSPPAGRAGQPSAGAAAEVLLTAGQQVIVPRRGPAEAVQAVDTDRELAWVAGTSGFR